MLVFQTHIHSVFAFKHSRESLLESLAKSFTNVQIHYRVFPQHQRVNLRNIQKNKSLEGFAF